MTDPISAYNSALYDRTVSEHGPTQKAVLEPRQCDTDRRFGVMAELWAQEPAGASISVLDIGCGYGAFLDYLKAQPAQANLHYRGIDISPAMVALAKQRHASEPFEWRDILTDPLPDRCVDYVILKGVLTAKFDFSHAQMSAFAASLLTASFRLCRKAIAFNTQNSHVSQRSDLFHWPFDEAAAFLSSHCSRRYSFRADYGLYDYTAYVYRDADDKAGMPNVHSKGK